MPKPFDPVGYIVSVGQELVSAFETAGHATTPGQIGSAREVPVRDKLMHLLPHGVAVGSGCVIDSFGNTSRQMDVVLYEKDICPVFAINDDPASTYYPCEGVIAVGEVKSALGSAELEDTFRKIESAKTLRRYARRSLSGLSGVEDSVAFRKYGSPLGTVGTKSQEYNQAINPWTRYTVSRLPVASPSLTSCCAKSSLNSLWTRATARVRTSWLAWTAVCCAHWTSLPTVTTLRSRCRQRKPTASM